MHSGCIIDRGYDEESICMPYGNRFSEIGKNVRIKEGDEIQVMLKGVNINHEVSIGFISNNEVKLVIDGQNINSLSDEESYDMGDSIVTVRDIDFAIDANDDKSSVWLRFEVKGSLFCGVNGDVAIQRDRENSCQNNYECLSNQCSNGVCIDLAETIKEEASGIKKFICRLFSWVGQDYNKCVGII